MLSYLAPTSRPDTAHDVRRCAMFWSNPKKSHEEAIKRTGRRLKRAKEKGMTRVFDPNRGNEVFVDAGFVSA